MQIRVAQLEDIETLFEIRTSVKENHQSREEIAALGITPATVAEMLQNDCRAWGAEMDHQLLPLTVSRPISNPGSG